MVQPDKNPKLGAFKDQMIAKHEQCSALRCNWSRSPTASSTRRSASRCTKFSGPLPRIVVNSNGATIETATSGYGNDAAKIVRSMFEGAITIAYLRQKPDSSPTTSTTTRLSVGTSTSSQKTKTLRASKI